MLRRRGGGGGGGGGPAELIRSPVRSGRGQNELSRSGGVCVRSCAALAASCSSHHLSWHATAPGPYHRVGPPAAATNAGVSVGHVHDRLGARSSSCGVPALSAVVAAAAVVVVVVVVVVAVIVVVNLVVAVVFVSSSSSSSSSLLGYVHRRRRFLRGALVQSWGVTMSSSRPTQQP